MTTSVGIPLARMLVLFAVLWTAGTLLTLPLFGFDWRKLVRSTLFVKILFWLPIFAVFLIALYGSRPWRIALVALLLLLALREARAVARQKRTGERYIVVYCLLFGAALSHFLLLDLVQPRQFTDSVIAIGFASALSDVAAFFMGKYLGKHKLPAAFNATKSWEGVTGQVVGALLGVLLVHRFVVVIPVWLCLPIGIGSAAGDLLNSYIKRKVGIKDWGNSIPGHGGYLDRLSSLSISAALTFYAVALFW